MLKVRRELKDFIKRWPKIYYISKGIYHTVKLRHLMELLFGTRVRESEWATRHLRKVKVDDWGNEDKDWIKGYWDSQTHPHRGFLIERIERFSPISSILEVGCNCGPNLVLLAKKFSSAEIRGIDINPMAIEKGKEYLRKEGILNVKLSVGKADELGEFSDKSFDIVFTDAVLICIGPDKIRKVIQEMLRVTKKALVLLEWHFFESSGKDKDGLGVYHYGFWKRDYISLLKQFVPEKQIRVTKIPEDLWPVEGWKNLGAIVEVVM